MLESYERILKALNLEKWMTIRQLARLLFQNEYHESQRKIYDRVNKNLRKLQSENLLKSKDYGLGLDNLWSLTNHKMVRELGYEYPKAEIHRFKYGHEKACADVFVTLALTQKLYGWEAHKKISKDIIPDRTADYGGTVYIEVEMGSQDKIREKADAYKQYFNQIREPFQVWFLVNTDKLYQSGLEDLRDFPRHYSIQKLSDWHSDMLSD